MLVDYGSSDDEDKKSDDSKQEIFVKPDLPTKKSSNETTKNTLKSLLPAPSSQKPKTPVTFTVPINTSNLKATKLSDDDDEEERPRKRLQTGSGTLSFLPAPKQYEEVSNVKSKAPPKPTVVKKQEQASILKQQENEDEEDPYKAVLKELAPNQSEASKRIPLSFAARNIPKEEQTQDEQPSSEENVQQPAQQYQGPIYTNGNVKKSFSSLKDIYAYPPEGYPEGYDPNYPNGYDYSQYYAQYYAQQQQQAPPVVPIPSGGNIPRNFARDFKDMSKGNVIEIRQDDFKQEMKRFQQANQDTTKEFNMFTELVKNKQHIDIMPSREGKKQHQVTYLLWEAKQKAAEIEAKRAEGIKNKKESRMRYGW